MIDASLGRAACCGFPGGMPQPPVPPFPPIPLPPTEPDAIQVQLATAQTALANGAAVPLSGVTRVIGNGLSFDTANHAVAVNEPGVYAFDWHVLVQSTAAEDPVIALQSLDGQTVLGLSGTLAASAANGTVLSGAAVAALPAGTSWVLVNASGGAIDIPVAGTAPASFAAVMTVAEISRSRSRGIA